MICFALPRGSVKNNMTHVALWGRGQLAPITVFQLQLCSLQIWSSLLVSKGLDWNHTSAVRELCVLATLTPTGDLATSVATWLSSSLRNENGKLKIFVVRTTLLAKSHRCWVVGYFPRQRLISNSESWLITPSPEALGIFCVRWERERERETKLTSRWLHVHLKPFTCGFEARKHFLVYFFCSCPKSIEVTACLSGEVGNSNNGDHHPSHLATECQEVRVIRPQWRRCRRWRNDSYAVG